MFLASKRDDEIKKGDIEDGNCLMTLLPSEIRGRAVVASPKTGEIENMITLQY
jgi:hypothetical protein